MNSSALPQPGVIWREPLPWWLAGGAVLVLLGIAYFEGLRQLVEIWAASEEYSYGYLIPALSAFFIWQKRDQLRRLEFTGSWAGVGLLVAGVILLIGGELATLYIVVQYGLLLSIAGAALAFVGPRAFKLIGAPLLILVFMVPLPQFLYQGLSASLQLISSELGVAVIRLFGISVSAEGNVIDLGSYKLQVVEACSGLRYLFPLMTFGFIAAYLYKAPAWKRAVVFFSTIPITVLMNSFRIGVIGVTVEYWGPAMAEGFLHDFEGWIVFMACTAVLFVEIWLLTLVGSGPRPRFRDVFGLEPAQPAPRDGALRYRTISRPMVVAAGVLLFVAGFSVAKPERAEWVPPRSEFVDFPMDLGSWHGQGDRLDKIYVEALKFDDYVMANYAEKGGVPVNFYVAYYGSQRKGQSAHSPRSCMPGDGWRIEDHTVKSIDSIRVAGQALRVNRVLIQKGDARQLVYYWFQQRGRVVTNEYLVKWYIFWDAITRNRTDGALVRLTTTIAPGTDPAVAEARLLGLAQAAAPQLSRFIPE